MYERQAYVFISIATVESASVSCSNNPINGSTVVDEAGETAPRRLDVDKQLTESDRDSDTIRTRATRTYTWPVADP